MNSDKKLFLLDAYALIFRAYYAFIKRPITNSKGLNTSAIFGFTNSLDEILRKEKPTHIAVAFDPPAATFRHKLYSDYKANRAETPEDIKKSIPYIKKIIEAYNIPILEVIGFEADDVIGTVAKRAEKEGFTVFMMTPDKDFSQLVSDNIFIYKPGRSGDDSEIIGPDEIKKLFHINDPLQVIDVLALWGDASDNVPGVPGIGEKTAKSLIEKYQSVDAILNNTDELKGKIKENILNNKEQLLLSKTLVTIETNVPIDIDFEQFVLNDINKENLKVIFDELEFRTLSKRILSVDKIPVKKQFVQGNLFETPVESFQPVSNLKTITDITHNYHLVNNKTSFDKLTDILSKVKEFCFDTETTGLDVYESNLVGISFSIASNEAYYIPFIINDIKFEEIIRGLKPIFEDESITKIGQNLKFDIQILKNYNIEVKGKLFDTMIAHYLVEPELRHNMDYLSEIYLNYKPVSIESLIGNKGKNQLTMDKIAVDVIKDYACEDADVTYQLYIILKKELEKYNLQNLAESVEMPLVRVLAYIERCGFKINTSDLNSFAEELSQEIVTIEKQIIELAGTDFNISSPKQLGEVLFDKLKIKDDAKKTKSKQYSTSEETLMLLKDKHPIIEKILEHRMLKKLLSTYVEALPKLINKKTGKIHTSFEQAWVATGRLSSKNPNLQNIPIRDEKGREIRKSFISSNKDFTLVSADYSQIELRLMAHMSQDENLILAFNNNEDIHASTASKIYTIPLTEVTHDMRRKAKTANFGIIYGISVFGLSQRLRISRAEAKELIDGYFRSYTHVKEYMDKSIDFAKRNGYVETIMGRRRYLHDIQSANAMVRGFAERNAINAPLQGSAADIIKLAMVNLYKIVNNKYKTNMILQVHDELIFDVYKPELEEIKTIIKREMENAVQLSVPLVVDIGEGDNWFAAH